MIGSFDDAAHSDSQSDKNQAVVAEQYNDADFGRVPLRIRLRVLKK